MQQTRMGRMEWVLLIALSILWGGAFFFTKLALVELPPLTLVFFRLALASAILFLFFLSSRRSVTALLPFWPQFFGLGLLSNVIPFSLLGWGQIHISSGLASILTTFNPVFTVILAHYLTRDEKFSVQKVAGIGFGVAGVITMIGPETLNGFDNAVAAMLACLGAAFSYALAGIYAKRFRHLGVAPAGVALGQIATAAVIMLPWVLLFDHPWTLALPSASVVWSMLGLALFSTALAYVLFFRVLEVGGATNSSLVALLIPATAILLGSVFLGERLDSNDWIGLGLIAAGLIVINAKAAK